MTLSLPPLPSNMDCFHVVQKGGALTMGGHSLLAHHDAQNILPAASCPARGDELAGKQPQQQGCCPLYQSPSVLLLPSQDPCKAISELWHRRFPQKVSYSHSDRL